MASALEQWFQPAPSNCWCWWIHESMTREAMKNLPGASLVHKYIDSAGKRRHVGIPDRLKQCQSLCSNLHMWKQPGNIYASIVVSQILKSSDPSPAKIANFKGLHSSICWFGGVPSTGQANWVLTDYMSHTNQAIQLADILYIAVMFLWGKFFLRNLCHLPEANGSGCNLFMPLSTDSREGLGDSWEDATFLHKNGAGTKG